MFVPTECLLRWQRDDRERDAVEVLRQWIDEAIDDGISRHAWKRMRQRGISFEEMVACYVDGVSTRIDGRIDRSCGRLFAWQGRVDAYVQS